MELVSVVVPVFNNEKYLCQCVTSILDQTYSELEIILIDDGSTDRSGLICDYLKKTDSRIVVVHTDNNGSVKARKKGLEIATGEYVTFVDSDDYIDTQMFEKMLNEIKESNADIVHTGFYREHERGAVGVSCDFSNGIFDLTRMRVEYILSHFFSNDGEFVTPSMWSKIYKTDLARRVFMKMNDRVQYGEDMIFFLRCCFEASTIRHVKEAYYHYRIHNKSMTNSRANALRCEVNLFVEIEKVINEYGYSEMLKSQEDDFLVAHTIMALKEMSIPGVEVCQYSYGNMEIIENKSIVLYGAGEVGIDYYRTIRNNRKCKIVAMLDANPVGHSYSDVIVYAREKILDLKYDYVLISVLYEKTMEIIKDDLLKLGVDENKILWEKPHRLV